MRPGDAILNLDFYGHLYIVLSDPTPAGLVVLANLTTHGEKSSCGATCVVVSPDDHPWPKHLSCVFYRGTNFNPVAPLDDAQANGTLKMSARCSDALLSRLQKGALETRMVNESMKRAIRETIARSE